MCRRKDGCGKNRIISISKITQVIIEFSVLSLVEAHVLCGYNHLT